MKESSLLPVLAAASCALQLQRLLANKLLPLTSASHLLSAGRIMAFNLCAISPPLIKHLARFKDNLCTIIVFLCLADGE